MTVVHYDADPHEVCVLENMWRSRVLAARRASLVRAFSLRFHWMSSITLHSTRTRTTGRTVAVQGALSPKTFWLETTESLAHRT